MAARRRFVLPNQSTLKPFERYSDRLPETSSAGANKPDGSTARRFIDRITKTQFEASWDASFCHPQNRLRVSETRPFHRPLASFQAHPDMVPGNATERWSMKRWIRFLLGQWLRYFARFQILGKATRRSGCPDRAGCSDRSFASVNSAPINPMMLLSASYVSQYVMRFVERCSLMCSKQVSSLGTGEGSPSWLCRRC
jgi:hypothetical protein